MVNIDHPVRSTSNDQRCEIAAILLFDLEECLDAALTQKDEVVVVVGVAFGLARVVWRRRVSCGTDLSLVDSRLSLVGWGSYANRRHRLYETHARGEIEG
jgi:hypothetical protein